MDGWVKKESCNEMKTQSRRSTYKRQKQYFEQRKRQQQQQTSGLESHGAKQSCSQHPENNRSLDILSWLNLSTVAQDRDASCSYERDGLEDCSLEDQNPSCPPTAQTNEAMPMDCSRTNEARSSSYDDERTVSPKKVSGGPPYGSKDSIRYACNFGQLKLGADSHISVIDLVSDDGANDHTEETSVHTQEAHVAFSVGGLGTMEMETPNQSPEQPGRYFLNNSSSLGKARRQASMTENFEYSIDEFDSQIDLRMQDVDFPFYDSSIEPSFSSRDTTDLFGYPKKCSDFRKSSPLNRNFGNMEHVIEDNEFFYHADTILDDSALLGNDVNNVGDLHWKNPGDVRHTGNADYLKSEGQRRKEIDFDGSYEWTTRNSKHGTKEFAMPDSALLGNDVDNVGDLHWKNPGDVRLTGNADYLRSVLHRTKELDFDGSNGWTTSKNGTKEFAMPDFTRRPKNQLPEELYNFKFFDTKWYSGIGTHHDIQDNCNQSARANFGKEDRKEALSSLSEESCSSTAGWAYLARKSPERRLNKKKQNKRKDDCWSLENKHSDNICYAYDSEMNYLQQREDTISLGNNNMFGKPPHSGKTNSCIGGFWQTGMRKNIAPGPSAWSKDLLGDSTLPLQSPRSSHDEPPPCRRIVSQKVSCQPFGHTFLDDTPCAESTHSGMVMPKLSQDSNKGDGSQGSLHTQIGSEHGSLSTVREKNLETPPIDSRRVDVSDGSKDVSAEKQSQ